MNQATPAMTSLMPARMDDSTRAKLFWAVIGALVLGQLVAIYMLCSTQVDKAQVREAQLQMQRTALAECLDLRPQSTISSCTVGARREAAGSGAMASGSSYAGYDTARAAMSSAVPVSFSLR
jgi:hypothetical protein